MFGWLRRIKEGVKLKERYQRYERALVSSFLIGGFLLDFFSFRTLNISTTLLILATHLVLAAVSMVYIFWFDYLSPWQHPLWNRLRLLSPLVTQLAFGSLLSNAFLFYWFSGSISVSWPIFTLLIFLIVFNESFRHAYLRPVVQTTVFAFVLLSYVAVLFPYVFNALDVWVVSLAGGVSLLLALLFIQLLIRVAPGLQIVARRMMACASLVFVVMAALYVLNLLPPIPLSLREAGAYYNVKRVGNEYELIGERETFWNSLTGRQTLYQESGERIFVFTSIYSPADLNTRIYHRWDWYDAAQKKWVRKDRLSFFVAGGRVDGYRGYTYKTGLAPGKWRVSVETERGQVLGRVRFTYLEKFIDGGS